MIAFIWFAGVLVLIGLGVFIITRVRTRALDTGESTGMARAVGVSGAARCIEAIAQLKRLAASGDQPAIALAWAALEDPLRDDLPNCPAALRPQLAAALEECAASCVRPELKARLTAFRQQLG